MKEKSADLLANEIYSLITIMKSYCEDFAPENHEIACLEFLAEYLEKLSNELCGRF